MKHVPDRGNLWVLGPVVMFLVLCVLPITVPAATGSFARRVRGGTYE